MIEKTSELWADLHMHSYYSDGILSPEAIVKYAAKIGLRCIAITDHDTVKAVDEATETGNKHNVEVLTGIELSTTWDGRDIHVLGYCFDHTNAALHAQLELYRDERRHRAIRIIERLRKQGMDITIEEVEKKAGRGVIGRPHIADVMLSKKMAYNINDVFARFLGPDGTAYEDKYKITPRFAVELIENAGGVAVLAHPTLNMKETHVYDMIKAGIHGIECIHPKHTADSTAYYRRLTVQYGLEESGGSDCHGRGQVPLIGQYRIPYAVVQRLKDRAQSLRQMKS